MKDEILFLQSLGQYLKLDFGICPGFYLGRSSSVSCGVGHDVESQPIPHKMMYRWLKSGMSQNDVDVLLAKDMLTMHRVQLALHGRETWFVDLRFNSRIGWYKMAFHLGTHPQTKLQRPIQMMKEGKFYDTLMRELETHEVTAGQGDGVLRSCEMLAYNLVCAEYEGKQPEIIQPLILN